MSSGRSTSWKSRHENGPSYRTIPPVKDSTIRVQWSRAETSRAAFASVYRRPVRLKHRHHCPKYTASIPHKGFPKVLNTTKDLFAG